MVTATHWRVYAYRTQNDDDYWRVHELQFRETVGGPDIASTGTPISSPGADGVLPIKAFDGTTSTWWTSKQYDITRNEAWIGIQFPSPVEIKEIAISNGSTSWLIQSGKVEYSNDGVTWTPYDNFYLSPWSSNSTRVITLDPSEVGYISNNFAEATYTSKSTGNVSNTWLEVAQVEDAKTPVSTIWIEVVHSVEKRRRQITVDRGWKRDS